MATTLSVPGRKAIGYVYTFDDLTEIRRLERDLRIQDRLAAVGRLAAAIAHEIRNPLTSIAGSVSMLSGIADLSDEHRQLLQIVTRESERLNGIITDFFGLLTGKQYRFASVDLLPLLEDTLTLLEHRLVAENTGIRIERKYNFKEALTMADGDKIKQVFWNFCENAVRAMTAGGVLSVSLEQVGEDWQVNFADTGPGMSRQLVEKIFEPFSRSLKEATGLGLAIVYQIVQAMKARFGRAPKSERAVSSSCGCAGWLQWRVCRQGGQPRNRSSFPSPEKRLRPAEEVERMGNILVCDDERSICEMLDIALRREGHKVETVKSGEDAKRKLESALYDVVVTDIKMPTPMASKWPRDKAGKPRLILLDDFRFPSALVTHFLIAFGHRRFAREADAALFVHAEALDRDFVAQLDDIFGLLDAEIGQFADVDEPVPAGEEFHGYTQILDGAFAGIPPGRDGLVHISELANFRVKQTEDVVKLGDEIPVKCLGVDEKGRVRLSRKAAMAERDQEMGTRAEGEPEVVQKN